MATDRQLLFVFETPTGARIFVRRLVLTMRHLAIFIEAEAVSVIDGGEEFRRAQFTALARTSGAKRLGNPDVIPPR